MFVWRRNDIPQNWYECANYCLTFTSSFVSQSEFRVMALGNFEGTIITVCLPISSTDRSIYSWARFCTYSRWSFVYGISISNDIIEILKLRFHSGWKYKIQWNSKISPSVTSHLPLTKWKKILRKCKVKKGVLHLSFTKFPIGHQGE